MRSKHKIVDTMLLPKGYEQIKKINYSKIKLWKDACIQDIMLHSGVCFEHGTPINIYIYINFKISIFLVILFHYSLSLF